MTAILGYVRVSTTGQDLEAQLTMLTAAGVGEGQIFTDELSGAPRGGGRQVNENTSERGSSRMMNCVPRRPAGYSGPAVPSATASFAISITEWSMLSTPSNSSPSYGRSLARTSSAHADEFPGDLRQHVLGLQFDGRLDLRDARQSLLPR